jgi:putative protease
MADKLSLPPTARTIPELLAPAGSQAALDAAIRCGADAVYWGVGSFNARRKAENFTPNQIPQIIDHTRRHGVRSYLALNTLIADDELDQALDLAGRAYEAGIDAIIVQDTGLAGLLRQWLPDLPLHASTQMGVADRAGLRHAASLGCRRVILARELLLDEIAALSREALDLGLETEVFIHGALCVSWSGQCLISSLDGRSGNRGICAQPCRLPWTLSGDLSPARPLLGPRDQSLLDGLPQLVQAGVASCKIEGRMRDAAYVGPVVAVYRAALDDLAQAASGQEARVTESAQTHTLRQKRLLLAYNRGGAFSRRTLDGPSADWAAGDTSGSHGLLLGWVDQGRSDYGVLSIRLNPAWPGDLPISGDVLSIRRAGATAELASAPLGSIEQRDALIQVRGFHPRILTQMQPGDPVYVMSDRAGERLADRAGGGKAQLDLVITGGDPVRLQAAVLSGPACGITADASSPAELRPALPPERVREQLGKTGQTPCSVARLTQHGPVCLSIAALNALRRQVLEQLDQAVVESARRPSRARSQTKDLINKMTRRAPAPAAAPVHKTSIIAWYHRLPDDTAQLACGADHYVLPLQSLDQALAATCRQVLRQTEPTSRLYAWLPALLIGAHRALIPLLEQLLADQLLDGLYSAQAGPDYLTVQPKQPIEWIIDTTANVFNRAALSHWQARGATAICPSVELNQERLARLAGTGTANLELPLYGALRVLDSVYCPVGHNRAGCRQCHTGQDRPDPGRLYDLTDRRGQTFRLLTHPFACQAALYGPSLLSTEARVGQILARGSDSAAGLRLRLGFLEETSDERIRLTAAAHRLLAERMSPSARQAWQTAVASVAARLGRTLLREPGLPTEENRSP